MRYSRQEIIEGWDQKRLKDSKIAVVGSNNLASFVLADLIAMGFGNITQIGENSLDFLDLKKINPDVEIVEIPGEVINLELASDYIQKPNYILELSGSGKQKRICLQYAAREQIPTVSARCCNKSYSIKFLEKYDKIDEIIDYHKNESSQEDGVANAIVASGIIVDELRKRLMPLKDDKRLKKLSVHEQEHDINQKIFLVGAGGIGTFAGIGLASKNATVDVIDFDKVEESNLNRQILFYDSIGGYKAEVMAAKLSKNGNFRGLVGKIDKNYSFDRKYDFILSCVDNLDARYFLDLIAWKNKIPLINSGTSLFGGSVMPVVYGKTACLDCQMFGGLTQRKNEKKEGSCYEPSMIISNQIIGGILLNKISRVLNNNFDSVKYDSNSSIKKIATLESCLDSCKR